MAGLKKKPAVKAKKNAKKTAGPKPAKKKRSPLRRPVRKAAPKSASKKTPTLPQGVPEQMLAAALKVLDERQAQEIATIPLMGLSSIADYIIIASGRTGRQVAALADHLREAFMKFGAHVQVEGQANADWVLVDAGDIIVHLFIPEVRRYYDLDSLWEKKAK